MNTETVYGRSVWSFMREVGRLQSSSVQTENQEPLKLPQVAEDLIQRYPDAPNKVERFFKEKPDEYNPFLEIPEALRPLFIASMENIQRWAGRGIESDLDHILGMLGLYRQFVEKAPAALQLVDDKKVRQEIILHDAAEGISGDEEFSGPAYEAHRAKRKRREKWITDKLLVPMLPLHLQQSTLRLYETYENPSIDNPTEILVHLLDKLDGFHTLGTKSIIKFPEIYSTPQDMARSIKILLDWVNRYFECLLAKNAPHEAFIEVKQIIDNVSAQFPDEVIEKNGLNSLISLPEEGRDIELGVVV